MSTNINHLKVALIQLAYHKGVDNALSAAEKYIEEAAENGAQIVVLPEMFCCPYSTRKFPEFAQASDGEMCTRMAEAARKSHIFLVAGTIPELDNEKIYNTAFVYDPSGRQIARHRKMHLFDISIEGGMHFQESETLTAGDDITVFDTPFGKVGLAVCYDIRFFEIFRLMQKEGCKIIIVPGCFNSSTGPAHWELLFRSRAVDTQGYLIGCAQARTEEASYVSYAHSIVCDPWGNVVIDAGTGECAAYADLDLDYVDKVRAELPFSKQMRSDIYTLTAVNKASARENFN